MVSLISGFKIVFGRPDRPGRLPYFLQLLVVALKQGSCARRIVQSQHVFADHLVVTCIQVSGCHFVCCEGFSFFVVV